VRTGEVVAGRNAVLEALRAGVPASVLQLARGVESEPRLREALRIAGRRGLPVVDAGRAELDRLAPGNQGLALLVPAYRYQHPDDLLAAARSRAVPPLLVACDQVTDPRNLGAIARSAAAFGASGLLVPERRSAGVTASAWKASAGAFARLPVARATNLVRTLRDWARDGVLVAGLAPDGAAGLADLPAGDPLVLVIGGEGRGLSRLARETCDLLVGIRMAGGVESLNAAVAAGIALHGIASGRIAQSIPGCRDRV
jgi:23S rRNA (guanosine2251-2'-O)-methyltransferase